MLHVAKNFYVILPQTIAIRLRIKM